MDSKRSCVRCKRFWGCSPLSGTAKWDSSSLYFTINSHKMQGGMMFCCAEMRCWRNDVCAMRKMMCRCAAMEGESSQGELFAKLQASSPSRENGIAERLRAFRYPENKNNSSAIYAQSKRGAHFKSSVPPLPQALRFTTQSPTWKNSAAGCAAATEKASGCGARRGAMHGWRCTGAPDTPCPGCASSG